jgi:hypothetical protein
VDLSLFALWTFSPIHLKLSVGLQGDKPMKTRLDAQLMKSSTPLLVLAFLIATTLIPTSPLMAEKAVTPPMAQETIKPLITKDLAVLPGEQVLMYTVDFPPGFSSPVHRHNAQVSVYVLEGSVVIR